MSADDVLCTDADIEQAALARAGNALAAARRAGRCTHGSAVGYRAVALYPAQVGLRRGQVACTAGCGRVFGSEAAWQRAIQEAMDGCAS